jgi:hypothetical protein
MTDTTRLAALEALAEKAAALHQAMLAPIGSPPAGYLRRARKKLEDAFSALNALPAAPAPAEVVKVAVWEYPDGEIRQARAGSHMDRHYHAIKPWTRLGTVRLPIMKGDGA